MHNVFILVNDEWTEEPCDCRAADAHDYGQEIWYAEDKRGY